MRDDLAAAYTESLRHVSGAGAMFDGPTRRRIADVALDSFLAPSAPPPWARTFGDPALDLAARLARHAGTISVDWYRTLVAEGLEPLHWVEVVGVVVSALAPVAFARAAGRPIPSLPAARPGPPTGRVAEQIEQAQLNWVPVSAPADTRPAVIQALSALPGEWDNMWQLAAVQYMTDDDMVDPKWTRGTLSRPQMELVATRLSYRRECFY